jgi:cytochrome P450
VVGGDHQLGGQPRRRPGAARAPSLIQGFVEESLRLEAPIQGFYRLAMADAEVGDVVIPAGSRVFVLYGSANRDENTWPNCPHLEQDRPNDAAHLAFGRGAHSCIGSALARLEGRVVIEVLLDRLTGFELTVPVDEVPYGGSFVNHGPISLPATLTFRSPAPADAAVAAG